MEFVEHTFQLDGVKSFYWKAGKGPPLLFLCGLALTPKTYTNVLTTLATSYTVYAPQLPAFGNASAPKTLWTFREYGQYMDRFLEIVGADGCTVVGHSFGGGVALMMAAYSMRTKRVVAVNPGGKIDFYPRRRFYFRAFTRTVLGRLMGKETLTLQTIIDIVYTAMMQFPRFFHVYRITEESLGATYNEYGSIHKPVLFLCSDKEEIVDRSYFEYLKRTIPHAKKITVDGYHEWLLFHPKQLLEYVKEFGRKE
ncbi:alpha/beta fold hydrolase [Patescibacteria group bacterium]